VVSRGTSIRSDSVRCSWRVFKATTEPKRGAEGKLRLTALEDK
jgi:hypothetical protein